MKLSNLDIVKITESAALAASKHFGNGDKYKIDEDASNAMRQSLNDLDFIAEVIFGEYEKDNAPGLFNGEILGRYKNEYLDKRYNDQIYEIIVDPVDGTTKTSIGGNDAISIMAIGEQDCFNKNIDSFYMKKLAVGPKLLQSDIDIKNKPLTNLTLISSFLGKKLEEVTVCILNRQRNIELIDEIRKIGCRLKLINDCDINTCVLAGLHHKIDIYLGIGGTTEGILSAVCLKILGGKFQGILCDKEGKEKNGKVLDIKSLIKKNVVCNITGITDGSLLRGVVYSDKGPITSSLVLNSYNNTYQLIETHHSIQEENAGNTI